MIDLVLYIHGKGGSAEESDHYKPLFPNCKVVELDYKTFTPWETGKEILKAVESLHTQYKKIVLIANSIGAFFSMNAGIDGMISRAYFISPIVNMERLILDMMAFANITEKELAQRGFVSTSFGEDLTWDYLCYVREHPISWSVPTKILYGSSDHLIDYKTVQAFAHAHDAELTVMEEGEHWFHTDDQMKFLDNWIKQVIQR